MIRVIKLNVPVSSNDQSIDFYRNVLHFNDYDYVIKCIIKLANLFLVLYIIIYLLVIICELYINL